MDEIVIDEKNQKRLQEIDGQIKQLGTYMRIIGDTLVNNAKAGGEYRFTQNFEKLIKAGAENLQPLPAQPDKK